MLAAHDLTIGYPDKKLLTQASFTINSGEITCVIGANGCGKSSLLHVLAGLTTPLSGRVTLANKTITEWPKKALARKLSLLPQAPEAPEGISVFDLLMHGRFCHKGLLSKYQQSDIDAIDNALKFTGMESLREQEFNLLSGGERQRGWLALALAQESEILLLDEPTTYLDIGHQQDILRLLKRLNIEKKLTIVMVLHDINQASQYADRILTLQAGNIIADNHPKQVINPELIKQVFGIDVDLISRNDGDKKYSYCIPV